MGEYETIGMNVHVSPFGWIVEVLACIRLHTGHHGVLGLISFFIFKYPIKEMFEIGYENLINFISYICQIRDRTGVLRVDWL